MKCSTAAQRAPGVAHSHRALCRAVLTGPSTAVARRCNGASTAVRSHAKDQSPPGTSAANENGSAPAAWKQQAVAAVAAAALILGSAGPAAAGGKEKVAEFAASGLLFKDTVEVTALDDPEVEGVTIYFSDFKRSLVDKLQKDFFAEPSQVSLACDVSGPVSIKDVKRISGPEGKELFAEKKGLNLFKDKTLRVRRVYDAERRTLIYVGYSTRLSDDSVTAGRYKTSICTVRLPDPAPPLPASEQAPAQVPAGAAAGAAAPAAGAPVVTAAAAAPSGSVAVVMTSSPPSSSSS